MEKGAGSESHSIPNQSGIQPLDAGPLFHGRVWGTRYIDGLILRDRNNGTGGHWGLNSSGLDERILSLQDASFNTVALLNASGTVIKRFTYTAYGEVKELNPDFTDYTGTDYHWACLYTGRRMDEETGLYFYRARYYHAQMGRFGSRDPIGYGDGMNLYAYASGSAVNAVDPFGTQSNAPPAGSIDIVSFRQACKT